MSTNMVDFWVTDLKPSDSQLLSDANQEFRKPSPDCVEGIPEYSGSGYLAD
jgi:hypothetical protein